MSAASLSPSPSPQTFTAQLRALWRGTRGLVFFLVLMALFRSAIADHMHVPTGSMNPTVVEGDQILVNKLAYGWRVPFTHHWLHEGDAPARGEIITFDSPEDGQTWLKRVVGLPGDTVEMRDERLFINGQPLAYGRGDSAAAAALPKATRAHALLFATEQLGDVAHPIMVMPAVAAMRDFAPVTVPPGQYLLLGDNRDNSRDSRYIGMITRERITGRAHTVVLSLNYDNHYLPREGRFIKDLK